VVLLHGLNAHSGTWRKNIPFLSTHIRVVAPSLPPWRGTSHDLDVTQYVRSIEEFLTILDLGQAVIVGNSMGGMIATKIAANKPELIRAIILEDSATDSRQESILTEKIDRSGIPVLLIWGHEDKIIPLATANRIHSKIKKSTLVVLEGTGHVPHWEKPELFNNLVLDFQKSERNPK
jgi:pimeloyl-ACP methyl ester carboxylesterase